MTEQEWQTSTDFNAMWNQLEWSASYRKLRLFAVACCRRIWPLIKDERCRRAVEVAERFADGQASRLEVEVAESEARTALPTQHPSKGVTVGTKAWRETRVMHAVARAAWYTAANNARNAAYEVYSVTQLRGLDQGEFWQCDLLREMFGNPIHPATTDPSWLTTAVVGMATAIYADRTFDRLPILADALEEAGCTNAGILGHCRGLGPHVRGCWVVDLLLGKE
jgi:hypothetical protein